MRTITALIVISSLTLVGGVGSARAGEPPESPAASEAAPQLEGANEASPPPVGDQGTDVPQVSGPREGEVIDAVKRYRDTGRASVITRNDTARFPFGESQPLMRCTPLRACDIELQAGEVVTGVALGDTERWVTSPLESGAADDPTSHVIVKPKDYDLATNIVIGTDRRTYHLGLLSPPKKEVESGETAYFRHVAFYYPQEMVERWSVEDDRRRRAQAEHRDTTAASLSALSVSELNFDYSVRGDRRIAWNPRTVFDDGRHVYIQLPEAVRSADLPALLVQVEGGGMAISNYRVKGTWYIVDGLFEKAELVSGVRRKRKKVEIVNRSMPDGGA